MQRDLRPMMSIVVGSVRCWVGRSLVRLVGFGIVLALWGEARSAMCLLHKAGTITQDVV